MEQIVQIASSASPAVSLTPPAVEKVRELLDSETDGEDWSLRIAVRPGGCSGFSYEMFFDADVNEDDWQEAFEGVKVVVDSASIKLLRGSALDYKDGLMDAGFVFNNPNVSSSCGCGNSFS